jgi:hypothetical protein
MKKNLFILLFFVLLPGLSPLHAKSGAAIKPDKEEFDAGKVLAGSAPFVKHAFAVKNTGDTNLVIRDVRPGCGCTAVGFDTIIKPGHTGFVTAEVNLARINAGEATKCITVFSNAKNKPELHLCLKLFLLVPVKVASYPTFKKTITGSYAADVLLSTDKTDLAVSDVTFETAETNTNDKATLFPPRTYSFSLKKNEKQHVDGLWNYTLTVTLSGKVTRSESGVFKFKTNHPQALDVTQNGAIEY